MQKLFNLGSILFNVLTIIVIVIVSCTILTPQSYIINLNPVNTPTKHTVNSTPASISATQIPTATPSRPIAEAQLKVRTSNPVNVIIIRSHKKGGCASCFSCTRLDTYLSNCTDKNDQIEAIIYISPQRELKRITANPNTGTASRDTNSYHYTYDVWTTSQRIVTFTVDQPLYLRNMPKPEDVQINPELRRQ